MNDKLSILYIDDYELDRELVRDALEKEHGGFEVTEASSRQEFETLLKTREFDVVLSDFNIAGFEGLRVLEAVQAYDPRIPVIIVTGTGSEEIAVMALKQGAADYVIKRPRHILKLPQTIQIALKVKRLQEERESIEKQLQESEERYRAIFEQAADGILLVDAETGETLEFNDKVHENLGYTREEFKKLKIPDFEIMPSPGEVAERIANNNRERSESFETKHRAKNGDIRNILVSSRAIIISGRNYGLSIFRDITESKRMEEALHEALLRQNEAVRAANVGLWDWDLVTDKAHYSAGWKRQIGYEEHEIGDDFEEWKSRVHPDDLEPTLKKVQNSIAEVRKDHQVEFRFRHKDGSYRWILTQGSIITDKAGHPIRMLGSHVDITDRKRIEEALRKSERLHKEAQRVGRIGHWELDSRSGTPVWSEQIFHIFGLDPESSEPSFSDHANIVHNEDWGLLDRSIQELNTNGTPFDIEFRILRSNGETRWMHARGSADKSEDGSVTRMFGTAQDITERIQVEEELRQSKARLELATAAAKIGHWDWNIMTNEVFFSSLWKSQLGYKNHELPNRFEEWESRLHPYDHDRVMKALNDYIEGLSSGYALEFRLKHKDETYRWIYTRADKMLNDDGRAYRILGCHIDITERKRMGEEFLKNQKLESVGILAGGIAHDFNNILTTIIGNIAMARMQARPGDEIFDLLSEAEKASIRAQTLTKQLLTFAKGGAPIKETASIKDILKESPSFVLRGSKSSCKLSIAEDLWPAEVDVGQISQAINNIVINASQAMPEGGTIRVEAENLTIDDGHGLPLKLGRYIRVSIKDQGVGIAEKHLSNIFDPYFTTKQEGSGLGLATTYSTIKKHDGHITVESKLGEGTTFHIYLPASEKAIPEKEEIKLIKGQGRILVMDDEASLGKMVGRMLKKLGYESEFTDDGTEAIEMYKAAKKSEKPYDAVILDLTIPGGMGGKEAINKLLEIDPEVKAIVSSGYSDDPVLANFQEYGFKGMMPKPFESLSLSKVLHEVIEGKK